VFASVHDKSIRLDDMAFALSTGGA